jgi:HEAT repeat protein
LDDLAERAQVRGVTMMAGRETVVHVSPFGLLYEGEPVDPVKSDPATLQLFKDGVRELRFLPGLSSGELRSFGDVLAIAERGADQDLITRLFKRDLKSIRYYASDSRRPDTDHAELSADDPRRLNAADALLWVRESKAPKKPSATHESTAAGLRGSFFSATDYARFLTMARGADGLTMAMYDSALVTGEIASVTGLLAALAKTPEAGDALRDAILESRRLTLLAALFDRDPGSLSAPIRALCAGREAVLVSLLSLLKDPDVRAQLREQLMEAGVELTEFYSSRVESHDKKTVIEALQALSKIGTIKAIKAMGPALDSASAPVRRAALDAMSGNYHPDLREALGGVLWDSEPENRMLALRILRSSGDKKAAEAILATVQNRAFTTRRASEKKIYFQALAAFKDRRALEFFSSILERKNLLRSQDVISEQITAVKALADMATPEAIRTIRMAAKRWYLPKPVREAAEEGYGASISGADP